MSEIHRLQQSFQTVTKLPLTKMTSCLESSSSHQTVIFICTRWADMNKQNDHLMLCWPWTSGKQWTNCLLYKTDFRKVFSFILNPIILQLNHTCKILIIEQSNFRLWREQFRSSSFIIQRGEFKKTATKKSDSSFFKIRDC